jgi:hypothetical protein
MEKRSQPQLSGLIDVRAVSDQELNHLGIANASGGCKGACLVWIFRAAVDICPRVQQSLYDCRIPHVCGTYQWEFAIIKFFVYLNSRGEELVKQGDIAFLNGSAKLVSFVHRLLPRFA